MTTSPQPPAATRTAERALTLLEFAVTAEKPPGLAEAARAAGLALSTTSRLLGTLESLGFLHRASDGRYWPGTRTLRMSAVSMRTLPLYDLSEEHLRALADRTRETAYLIVPADPGRALYLRQFESINAVRHASWLGQTIPLRGTATGKALAGKVGKLGYAVNRGAVEPDSATAAAPVYGPDNQILAALSVIAPAYRVDDDFLHKIGDVVAQHALELSDQLGADIEFEEDD
jgi:IclR family transcriptional regulator, acetate operon repressor